MHGFNWYSLFPGYHHGFDHIIGAVLVLVLLTIAGFFCWRHFKKQEVVPSNRFSITAPFEIVTDMLLNLMKNIIGPHSEHYLPLVGTIFFFILTCNLLGMIPGFLPPTDNINTNIACALVVFVATHFYGMKASGVHYGKQFLAPIAGIGGLLLSLLFTPIELVSHAFRPVSLSVRLWGNIFADHTVLGIMEQLVPIGLPIPFLFLGLLVAVVQAFIFSLLTMIYIALAVSEHH
jgi:F-type H+-transporting ATPase subunit a